MAEIPVAQIEAGPIPSRYARGWHCLGLASDYGRTPQALNIFGTKLVVFRGDDGQVHILDGYCPHMGADLSLGCVEGTSIRCPFHGWRWGADGFCDEIPYANKIPPKARIKSWPACEANNLLFIYNDPEGNPPPAEVAIPEMPECSSEEWMPWSVDHMLIETNCRELVDNVADKAHFGPVHNEPSSFFKNIFEGHVATQIMTGTAGASARLAEDEPLTTTATYYGPAYQITEMSGAMGGVQIDSRLLNCHVPIDENNFDLRYGVMVKKIPGLSDAQNQAMANEYIKLARDAFYEDVDIWKTKTRVDNPMMCDGDGPVYRLREWYNQFYMDAADVPAKAKERREYEIENRGPAVRNAEEA